MENNCNNGYHHEKDIELVEEPDWFTFRKSNVIVRCKNCKKEFMNIEVEKVLDLNVSYIHQLDEEIRRLVDKMAEIKMYCKDKEISGETIIEIIDKERLRINERYGY